MKKVLALVMAFAMVLSLGVTAFADHDPADEHGKVGGPVISGTPSDNTTDFYLNIDKDADSGDGPTTDVEDIAADESGNRYIIDYDKSVKSNLSLTVPLFVCMYAYGGDGKVIAPETGYAISNSSTYTQKTAVTKVTRFYKVAENLSDLFKKADGTQYWADDDALRAAENNVTVEIGDETIESGTLQSLLTQYGNGYGYFIKNDDTKVSVILLSSCKTFDGDNNYYAQGEEIKTGTVADVIVDGVGKTNVTIGSAMPGEKNADNAPLAVSVTNIAATAPTGWTLRPSTDVGKLTVAKELTLSINGVDMYLAAQEGGYNLIGENKMNIAAPTVSRSGEVTAIPLTLPITASIAGNSVNDDGDAQVLTVTYTITPDIDNVSLSVTYPAR